MEKPYVVGIDIGGTNTVFGIVDARGTILASGSIKTGAYEQAEDYVDEVCKNLLPLIIANGGVDKIKGIGIGAPNGNYYSGTIEFAPNLPWKGVVPLAAMFEERLGIPTALTNDANAAANASAETQTRIAELQGQIADLNTQIQNYQNTIQTLSVVYEGSGKTYSEAVATPEDKRTDAQKKLISDIDTYNAAVAELPNAQASLAATESELTALNTVDDAGYAALAAQYESAYAQWEAAYNAANAAASQPSAGMSSAEMNNLTISDNLAELAAMSQSELLEKAREGMKADMNGVIASVEVLQTNAAAQGAAVFSIASTENVRVKVDISPDDYEKMTVGTPATITIGEHKYEGTLENVNRIATNNAKGNPVIGAQIHISNPDEYICIGATAKVSMTVAQSDNVLTVPIECINTSTSGDFVFVIENGTVKKKPVELGTASTTAIEVKSGLKEGDQVVNDLNVDVTEGMKATAVPSTDTTTPKDAASEKQEDTKKQTDSEKQDAPSADK